MTSHKKTLFISDLHLDDAHPARTACFLRLLKDATASADALYILGDLFEAWIGDDDDDPLHLSIMDALFNATQHGLKIYFIAGNRDFLIGKRFSRRTGVTLLPDEKKIMVYDKPVLLMHGDTLCTKDTAYLKWRRISHNRFLHTLLFLAWPLSIRQRMANKMRSASHQHTQSAHDHIMDVTQAEVERIMRKHNTDTLIHGHTHRPDIHQFTLDQKNAKRIVLDAWHDHGSAIEWYPDGSFKPVIFTY